MPTAWGSRSFNGTSDNINCGSSLTLQPTPTNAISAWILTSSNRSVFTYAISRNNVGNNTFFEFGQDGSNNWTCFFTTGGGTQNLTTITVPTANIWYHVLVYYTNVTGGAFLVNGVSIGTIGNVGSMVTGGGATFNIGKDPSAGGNPWGGKIADVAVFNFVPAATEISGLVSGARPNQIRGGSGLVGWFPLDGLQSPEPDLSGNANNGTLTGTTAAFGPPYAPFTPRWPQFIPAAAGGGSAIKFRKTLSQIGGRVGSRQIGGFMNG